MLPLLLLALGVLASASGGRGCARGAAAGGASGACEAGERDETSHLQVRGSVREAGSSVGQGAAAVGRVRGIRRSAAQRARRRSSKTSVVAAPEGEPEYFRQGYGGPSSGGLWSWFTGVVATDTVSLAGVSAERQRFGLVQMGNMPIGNTYPSDVGPSAADGILGLMPGCLIPDSTACKKSDNATDVIANLYFSGQLSEYAFAICLRDSEEGGGAMWLGASSAPLPEGSIEVPLQFDSHYTLVPPPGEPDIPFYLGSELLFTMNASDYDTLFGPESIVDSGSNGFKMPFDQFNLVWDHVQTIWMSDSDIKEAIYPEVLKNLSLVGVAAIQSEIAQKMKSLVPDLIFTLGDANVSVLGSSLLFQTTPCSGEYSLSWGPGDIYVFGSSFWYGRTLRFDLTLKTGDHTAVGTLTMIPDDTCEANYGEHGQGIVVSGVPGQVLGAAGAMTAVVSLGEPPQDFVVQLDTGSQDLMIYQDTCMLVGLGLNEGCVAVFPGGSPDRYLLFLRPGPPDAPAELSPPECEAYSSGIMNLTGNTQILSTLPLINSLMSENLKPWTKCNEDRILCGTGSVFNTSVSQSLMPKNFPQYVFAQDPPAGSGEVGCQLCNSNA